MKETKSFRINNQAALDGLALVFENQSEGINRAIEAYLPLRNYTLQELKGIFDESELIFLIARSNATFFESKFAANKQMTIIGLQDYFKLENQEIKDFDKLIQKINNLTASQLFFLNEFCHLFWYDEKNEQKNLNEYLKKLG